MNYPKPNVEFLRGIDQLPVDLPFPFKALAFAIVGTIICSIQLNIQVLGISLSYIPLSLGSLLVAYGFIGVANSGAFLRSSTATALVVLALLGLIIKATSIALPLEEVFNELSRLCFSIAFILSSVLLANYCKSRTWTAAQQAWKRTLIAAYALAGLQAAGLAYELAIKVLKLVPFEKYESHNIFVLILLILALASPYFLAISALQAMYRQDMDPSRHIVRKIVTHKLLNVGFALIILAPVLTLIPAYIHHTNTPTFDQYLMSLEIASPRQTQPQGVTKEWAGNQNLIQPGVDFREGEDIPRNHSVETHLFEIDLSHGNDPLLKLSYEVKAKTDGRNEFLPPHIEVSVLRSYCDPRFKPIIQSVVACEDVPLDPKDFEERYDYHKRWRIPHIVNVTLVPQSGPLLNTVYMVDDLQINLTSDASLPLSPTSTHDPELPPSSYNWKSQGVFNVTSLYGSTSIEHNGITVTNSTSSSHRSNADGAMEFSTSENEYSFSMKANQTLVSKDDGSNTTKTRKQTQSVNKTWNGEIW